MTRQEEVQKLAELARIEVPKDRLPKLAEEFGTVVAYIDQLTTLSVPDAGDLLPYGNVLRKDGEPHEKGIWTEKLVGQFPGREGNFLSVRKIIAHD